MKATENRRLLVTDSPAAHFTERPLSQHMCPVFERSEARAPHLVRQHHRTSHDNDNPMNTRMFNLMGYI